MLWTEGLISFKVMGDSSMVINWMKGSLQVQNNSLLPLAQQLKEISNQFLWVSYTHIYREHNKIADQLSKEGLQLPELYGSLEEVQDGHTMVLQQFSFNDFELLLNL
jgi:ribonuclease HI